MKKTKLEKKVDKEEIWKDIPGFEGLYQASNLGRIRRMTFKNGKYNFKKIKICNQYVDLYGYLLVPISKDGKTRQKRVHRLVASAFFGISNLQVDHIDGNKLNNNINNLEYVTAKENTQRAWKLGLAKTTDITKNKQRQAMINNGCAKQIVQYDMNNNIINIYESIISISRLYGYSTGNICRCCKEQIKTAYGYKWRYLNEKQ